MCAQIIPYSEGFKCKVCASILIAPAANVNGSLESRGAGPWGNGSTKMERPVRDGMSLAIFSSVTLLFNRRINVMPHAFVSMMSSILFHRGSLRFSAGPPYRV